MVQANLSNLEYVVVSFEILHLLICTAPRARIIVVKELYKIDGGDDDDYDDDDDDDDDPPLS